MTITVTSPAPEIEPSEVKARVDLRALVAPGRPIRGDRAIMVNCLWHDDRDPSLAVYPDRLKCFGCGRSMDFLDYVGWLEGIENDFGRVLEIALEKYVGALPEPPPAFKVERKPLQPMSKTVAEYMHKQLGVKRQWYLNRGLTDRTIDEEMLGYNARAFVIPVWSDRGELLTVRYRRDDDLSTEGSKYWGTTGRNDLMLYNAKALRLIKEWGFVVIDEGEFDALRLYQEGIPAVSATNGSGAFDKEMAEVVKSYRPDRVIVAYDQDESGMPNGIRVARMFYPRGRVMRWPRSLGKDVTEILKKIDVEDFVLMAMEAEVPSKIEKFWQNTFKEGRWL